MPIEPDILIHNPETVMESIKIFGYLLAFAIGMAAGFWTYRYTLKKNPAKLEKLAAEAKRLGDKARDRL